MMDLKPLREQSNASLWSDGVSFDFKSLFYCFTPVTAIVTYCLLYSSQKSGIKVMTSTIENSPYTHWERESESVYRL